MMDLSKAFDTLNHDLLIANPVLMVSNIETYLQLPYKQIAQNES